MDEVKCFVLFCLFCLFQMHINLIFFFFFSFSFLSPQEMQYDQMSLQSG